MPIVVIISLCPNSRISINGMRIFAMVIPLPFRNIAKRDVKAIHFRFSSDKILNRKMFTRGIVDYAKHKYSF